MRIRLKIKVFNLVKLYGVMVCARIEINGVPTFFGGADLATCKCWITTSFDDAVLCVRLHTKVQGEGVAKIFSEGLGYSRR